MIAYTEKLGFDVLTTPIAEVDRRTLSQAWFSALHLGGTQEREQPARASRKYSRSAPVRSAVQPADAGHGMRVRSGTNVAVSHRAAKVLPGEELSRVERRAPASVLARRIERSLLDRRVHHGTFVLDGMDGRVHLSVRSQHGRVHIVAVCAPHAKEHVAQALRHVRFALSRKGVALEGSLREMRRSHPFAGGEML